MTEPDRPALEIEDMLNVTPAMVSAGVEALRGFSLGESWEHVVSAVYMAMAYERESSEQ